MSPKSAARAGRCCWGRRRRQQGGAHGAGRAAPDWGTHEKSLVLPHRGLQRHHFNSADRQRDQRDAMPEPAAGQRAHLRARGGPDVRAGRAVLRRHPHHGVRRVRAQQRVRAAVHLLDQAAAPLHHHAHLPLAHRRRHHRLLLPRRVLVHQQHPQQLGAPGPGHVRADMGGRAVPARAARAPGLHQAGPGGAAPRRRARHHAAPARARLQPLPGRAAAAAVARAPRLPGRRPRRHLDRARGGALRLLRVLRRRRLPPARGVRLRLPTAVRVPHHLLPHLLLRPHPHDLHLRPHLHHRPAPRAHAAPLQADGVEPPTRRAQAAQRHVDDAQAGDPARQHRPRGVERADRRTKRARKAGGRPGGGGTGVQQRARKQPAPIDTLQKGRIASVSAKQEGHRDDAVHPRLVPHRLDAGRRVLHARLRRPLPHPPLLAQLRLHLHHLRLLVIQHAHRHQDAGQLVHLHVAHEGDQGRSPQHVQRARPAVLPVPAAVRGPGARRALRRPALRGHDAHGAAQRAPLALLALVDAPPAAQRHRPGPQPTPRRPRPAARPVRRLVREHGLDVRPRADTANSSRNSLFKCRPIINSTQENDPQKDGKTRQIEF